MASLTLPPRTQSLSPGRGAALARSALLLCALSPLAIPPVEIVASAPLPTLPPQAGADLYAQATQVLLDRKFPSSQVQYLLLNARTLSPIAERWPRPQSPMPVGSLLKPFVALAYSRMESSASRASAAAKPFPTVVCHGKSDGCWRTAGHGPMTLPQAVAKSCNAYFLALAQALTAGNGSAPTPIERVAADYALPPPPTRATAAMLIGLNPEWRIPPLALARAYAQIANSAAEAPSDPHPRAPQTPAQRAAIAQLLAGMRAATLPGGTAAHLGTHPGGLLAKTGTAPCRPAADSPCPATGDGLVIALAPADAPRWVLLVRQRATTGANAARIAGNMLTALEDSDDPAATR